MSDKGTSSEQYANLLQENAQLKDACEKAWNENAVLSHIAYALARDCVDLFYVNMDTGEYIEYGTDNEHGVLKEKRQAADFFESCAREAELYLHEDDRPAFVNAMDRKFLTTVLDWSNVFDLTYRRIKDDRLFYVQMKVTRMEDDDRYIVIAVSDIDEHIKRRRAEERMQQERLEQARSLANIDALTGVKNKHAFLEVEASMDHQIAERNEQPFAIVMFDVNDLKRVNDTAGHHAGDQLLRDACKIICNTFKHSPVFRIGGDEFVVIARGEDYECLEERLAHMGDHNAEALRTDGVVIACGMAVFGNDTCVATVFDRADRNMYENKNRLKSYRK